jgi:dynein heavy chain
MVVELEEKQKVAAEQEKVTAVEEAEAQKMFDSVSKQKSECQAELDKAMPIYKAALSALDTLNKADITEMKAYASPAEEIVMVVNAVCLLVGKKENWDEGKKLMGNPNEFIDTLKNYDKDNIKESLLKKLKKYTDNPKFEPDNIGKKSGAAKSICMWAKAIDNYSAVMKIIKPKQASLAEAEGELKVVQEQLRGKQ